MEEYSFFNEGGVTVTNARFIVSGQTFAMNGITSVKSIKENPSIKGPIILFLIGLFAFKDVPIGGIMFMALGIAWFIMNKPKYSVVLSSASGEAEALTSKDSGYIASIVNAINEAIVSRG